MSADAAALDIPIAGRDADRRPGMSRLTAVELRKMVDTRAGFWLQLAVVALTVIVVGAIDIWGRAEDQTLAQMLSAALTPAAVLLPVVGILLVSSEWSQRTAPITFALVPRRGRVITAKIAASVVLSLVAFVLCLAAAAVGTAIASPGLGDTWSLSAGLLGQSVLSLTLGVITGVAFGAALLSSAPAIVLSFVLPLGWAAIGSIHALEPTARWLDSTRSLSPLTEHLLSATEWARAGTTLLLWLALPLVIGMWRILRNEVA